MIRNQEVHSNGPVLDDVLLADPKVRSLKKFHCMNQNIQ